MNAGAVPMFQPANMFPEQTFPGQTFPAGSDSAPAPWDLPSSAPAPSDISSPAPWDEQTTASAPLPASSLEVSAPVSSSWNPHEHSPRPPSQSSSVHSSQGQPDLTSSLNSAVPMFNPAASASVASPTYPDAYHSQQRPASQASNASSSLHGAGEPPLHTGNYYTVLSSLKSEFCEYMEQFLMVVQKLKCHDLFLRPFLNFDAFIRTSTSINTHFSSFLSSSSTCACSVTSLLTWISC